ncbi:helix-turn-helix domain-containing protein [Maliponia aquimaris]|uniref:Bifunctional transcriptional activator/DNA repair enzyme AdaA n=1 Tax=Maliponia aquimaris TaxID=1673631 RepID=A0A238JZU5_9RHOB|nr:AraC family transcriptional regulator [Maliponia aquimaris]SMX35737.1 Bifunctional transcriptional activator/DNA repair enzyme AdaA [Maliponia aquimaris]
MTRPGFLRNPMPPAPARPKGVVRCGSYGLELQGAPWKFTLLHDREEDVLIWVTRGQGKVIVNGIRRGFSMNNALYLPAGTLFSVETQTGTQALILRSPQGMNPHQPQSPLLLRVRESHAQMELTGHIDNMSRELHGTRPLAQEAIAAHVALVAVWLQRQVRAGAADTPPETAAQRLVRRFAEAVSRDFRTPAPMADYAEALDVTPTHLSRTCRICCGKTAADILTERKLHAARIALESPRPAVKDVALSLGFSSPAYFTRFIQTHTGASPSALRAAAQPSPTRP